MRSLADSDARSDAPPAPFPGGRPSLETTALAGMAAAMASTVPRWPDQFADRDEPGGRTALRLGVTEDYDVWLLGWAPGTSVAPHDHGDSAGAFCVVSGEVHEVRWDESVRRTRRVGPGGVVTIDRGVVHDVVGGSEPALSVHVYSPPLTSMSFYDDSAREPIGLVSIDTRDRPEVPARALHPSSRGR